jgi:hypothetical protein
MPLGTGNHTLCNAIVEGSARATMALHCHDPTLCKKRTKVVHCRTKRQCTDGALRGPLRGAMQSKAVQRHTKRQCMGRTPRRAKTT